MKQTTDTKSTQRTSTIRVDERLVNRFERINIFMLSDFCFLFAIGFVQ